MKIENNSLLIPKDPKSSKVIRAYMKRSDKDKIKVTMRLDLGTTHKIALVQSLPEMMTEDCRILSRSVIARRALDLYLNQILLGTGESYAEWLKSEKAILAMMATPSKHKPDVCEA